MSRVEKFGTKQSLFKRLSFKRKKETVEVKEEKLPTEEEFNYRYSIITALIVTGLLFILKLLTRLEKQLFLDSQYQFNEVWNTSLNIGEAMFYSAFIPVGIFIIHFVFYFVSASTITRRKLEESYSRAIIYLIYCTINTIFLIPIFALGYFGNDTVSMILIIVLSLTIVIFIPQFIVRKITREQSLVKGYYFHLLIGFIIFVFLTFRPMIFEMLPDIAMEKNIYYSSEDNVVKADFKGTVIGGFVCRVNECINNADNGILLHAYRQTTDSSRSTFFVDLSDPHITEGTYEIRIYYRVNVPIPGSEKVQDQKQEDTVWYKKSIAREFHYIFDGQSTDDRKEYFMKYINRIKIDLKRETQNFDNINKQLSKFVTVMEQNDYYISEDMTKHEVSELQELLPASAKEIFNKLISDLVFYAGA